MAAWKRETSAEAEMLQEEDDFAVGDRLIWHPSPHVYEGIRVIAVHRNGDGETWVQTENRKGERYWNDEQRMREACVRER